MSNQLEMLFAESLEQARKVKNQVTHHYKPIKKTSCGLDVTKKPRKVSSFWNYVDCKGCLKHYENIRSKVVEDGSRWALG